MDRQTLTNLSDKELARQARAGSVRCFEELVRRYQVPLLRFLLRKSPRPCDAEDVLQEAFLRAYQSIHQYQDRYAFKTWLFTISYRLAVSNARGLRITTERASEFHSSAATPDERLEREESRTKLWDLAAQTLSEEQYSAVWLHYVESIPAKDIAKVLGRSWVWVKTALHRSRKMLLAALETNQRDAGFVPVVRGEA